MCKMGDDERQRIFAMGWEACEKFIDEAMWGQIQENWKAVQKAQKEYEELLANEND